jgi:hypothetical protein
MVAWCEFLFLLSPNGAKSSGTMLGIDQGLAQFLVAMTVPVLGLVLSLLASEAP